MEIDALLQSLPSGDHARLAELASSDLPSLINHLKSEADRHWRIDPAVSLGYADTLITIGEHTQTPATVALGLMAKGDAFRYLDQLEEAWEVLEQAGELYRSIDDQVGWARTRIGRLGICTEINQVTPALEDAELARYIFTTHHDDEKLLRLEINAALVLNYLGRHQEALTAYQQALTAATMLGEIAQPRLALIYNNMAYAYRGLGNLGQAQAYYERAFELMAARGETRGALLVNIDLADIALAQGQYKKALRMLENLYARLGADHPSERRHVQTHLIECYLMVNRFQEARELAHELLDASQSKNTFERAITLLRRATAETALHDLPAAETALDQAENLLQQLHADPWIGMVSLNRAQVAFAASDMERAAALSAQAIQQFDAQKQVGNCATAGLIAGQIALKQGNYERARKQALSIKCAVQTSHIPHLEYGANVLLGAIAEQTGRSAKALRYYKAGAKAIERAQRNLILHLHPNYLEDKQEASHGLIRLNIQLGRTEAAFAALERSKSLVWQSYINQRPLIDRNNPDLQRLETLRHEHYWYYRLAHDLTFRDAAFREQSQNTPSPEQAAAEAAVREQAIQAIVQRLSLNTGADELAETPEILLSEVQSKLDNASILLAYYSDGVSLWAFKLTQDSLELVELGAIVKRIDQLLNKLQANIDRALLTSHESTDANILNDFLAQVLLQLHKLLIAPLQLQDAERVVIVPYGSLHYLPFHLLRSEKGYWIEHCELAVLPAASLITRTSPEREPGALALAHSWNNRLKTPLREATDVVSKLGGQVYDEQAVTRTTLDANPRQVLHLAVHGTYRLDEPDFSFLELGDGPIYFDDLLQHDLSYELVTLSACESGRSQVSAGDELIGLGRGFLFAGAGALLASLWRVDDAFTSALMDAFYKHLGSGLSKASALRHAQCELLNDHPGLHPAFWGGFELIGNTEPLSHLRSR